MILDRAGRRFRPPTGEFWNADFGLKPPFMSFRGVPIYRDDEKS